MKTFNHLLAAAVVLATFASSARADDARPPADVLNLGATVTSEVAPDLAVIQLAIVREGPDVATLTRDVNVALAKAFADAKAVPNVVASSGGFDTQPRYYDRGTAGSVRAGWTVRAEIVLKSKDFGALGALVGRLSQTMQIAGSGFEVSHELQATESARLLDRGARAFTERATAAAKAFGFAGYTIRQIALTDDGGESRTFRLPQVAMMRAKTDEPMPLASGKVTLSLTFSGSVQLTR